MRANGSIKSLTTGVTTQSDKYQTGDYHTTQENFLSDNLEGLRRRPSLKQVSPNRMHVDNVFEGVPEEVLVEAQPTDVLHPVEIRDQLYWLLIRPNIPQGYVSNILTIWDKEGIAQTIDSTGYEDYLFGNDFAVAVVNDTVFILNKQVRPEMTNLTQQSFNTSMVNVKQAPNYGSKITVTWTDTSNSTRSATLYIPESTDPLADSKRTTNQVAIDLRDAMAATTSNGTTISASGSTISIVRSDNKFADVDVQDGDGGFGIIPVNQAVQNLSDLPAHAGPNSIIKIQPDPDTERGVYYMRGVPEREDSGSAPPPVPSPTFTVTAGRDSTPKFSESVGYYNGYIGSTTSGTIEGIPFFAFYVQKFFSGSASSEPGNVWEIKFAQNHNNQLIKNYRLVVNGKTYSGINPKRVTYIQNVFENGQLVQKQYINYEIPGPLYSEVATGTQMEMYINEVNVNPDDPNSFSRVTWVESPAPDTAIELDVRTMPHTLVRRATGAFKFTSAISFNVESDKEESLWANRTAGDNKTNPIPYFVGRPIRDIAVFQQRLCFLVDDTLVTSQAADLYDMFKKSAVSSLPSDPVSISSSATNGNELNHFVPHNRDLLIFSANEQYKLPGAIPLTPQTAALPLVASNNVDVNVKPVSVGAHAYFTFSYGKTTGVNKFLVQQDSQQDIAIPITHHVSRYIPEGAKQIIGNQNLNTLIVNAGEGNELFVYEYDSDAEKVTEGSIQSNASWSKWLFPDNMHIDSIYMYDSDVYVVGTVQTRTAFDQPDDQRSAIRYLFRLDLHEFSNVLGADVPEICLDYQLEQPKTGNTVPEATFTPPQYWVKAFDTDWVMIPTDPEDQEVFPFVAINITYDNGTFTYDDGPLIDVPTVIGSPFVSRFVPKKPVVRDASGKVQSRAHSRITQWLLSVRDTPRLSIKIDSPYQDWPIYTWEGLYMNSIHAITDTIPISEETLIVPYKQNINDADLEVIIDGYYGGNIVHMEWEGTYTKSGRRF